MRRLPLLALLSLLQPAVLVPDPPKKCSYCDAWNRDAAPARVFGNVWSVGTEGLSSILVTSPEGHVLLDGALPQSAPLIEEHFRTLGFDVRDVKLILVSHGHYDHAGGVAALQRFSGARVAASPGTAAALRAGVNTPDDPQAGFGAEANGFPAVSEVQELADGQELRVGPILIRAHHIPGHTPGSTAYTWRSCQGDDCRDVAYVDSLNAVSAPGFRYGADPERVASFRRSLAIVEALPCDVLLAPHPSFSVDRTCAEYAENARERLERRLAEEAAEP